MSNEKKIEEGNKLIYALMGGRWKAVENPDRNGMTSYKGDYATEQECQTLCDKINQQKSGSPRTMSHAVPHPVKAGFSGRLNYHESWDALMPVVGRIESHWNPYSDNCLIDEHEGSDFCIGDNRVEVRTSGYKAGSRIEFDYAAGWSRDKNYKLEATWQACIQFINWYNSKTKQP
jgi:hypothetical protein